MMLSMDIDTLAQTVLRLKKAGKREQAMTLLNDVIPDEGMSTPTALKRQRFYTI
ncbi:Uncharacterised protein [Budvicia aquatica]|uniref:Uncharacterized protein n=1 Tax=Budvicia aquatica TaxID=82979 RepID=A0A484ZEE1_9GAMM|nr:Uncharacterised protein [Budvicia aquatica]